MKETIQHKNLLTANRTAFLVIGCIEAAWGPLVPYVKEAFAIDEGTFGLLLLCSGLGSVIALPVAGYICMRQERGFALVGLGAANVVPQVVSFAGSLKGMSVLNIISTINALGYCGILVGAFFRRFLQKEGAGCVCSGNWEYLCIRA